jgi:hypothetical protein
LNPPPKAVLPECFLISYLDPANQMKNNLTPTPWIRMKNWIWLLLVASFYAHAAPVPTATPTFDGTWEYRKCFSKKEFDCESYSFELRQAGDQVCGQHSGSTRQLSQLNEGGPVRGIVVGKVAVLTVTSGRNNEIVIGKATLRGKDLFWQQSATVKEGEGDIGLIFGGGILKRLPVKPGTAQIEC